MANLEVVKALFMEVVKSIPQESLQTAAQKFGILNINFSGIEIDEDTLTLIKDFGLTDPRKMIRFLVEGYFAQWDSISESFDELKELDLINSRALIDGPKKTYRLAAKNEKDKCNLLRNTINSLNEGLSVFEKKAIHYIEKMREFDNWYGKPTFIFKVSAKKIATTNHCAKASIEAVITAINLLLLIANELDLNSDSILNDYNTFKVELLSDDNCLLMNDYDDDSKTEYWLKLTDRLDNAIDMAELLDQIHEEAEDDDLTLDNIEFN